MRHGYRQWVGLAIFGSVVALHGGSVFASFHQWRIDEVYSNASGTIQFIEFTQGSSVFDDERFLSGQSLAESALSHSYSFPANLPAAPVANQHFLVATPGYAALAGVPAPDYTLPTNNFFSISGDTLTFAGGVDTLTFTGAQMPTGGQNSLNRTAYGVNTFNSLQNTPTNFAGASGTVPEPISATSAMLILGAGSLLRGRCRR